MKTMISVLAVLALPLVLCHAADSDETLRYYLSKSDLVLQGRILNEPGGMIDRDGVPHFYCEFKVSDVLKGDAELKGTTVKVNIIRLEQDEKDHHPLIRKDAESILFLQQSKDNVPRLETADFWFGIQHPFPRLAKSVKRLAESEKTKSNQVPEDPARKLADPQR